MKKLRWLGLPAVAALAVVVFAVTAGIGSARTAAAPNNTTPPSISGKAQTGELLTTNNGTWTGTPTSFTYQWRVCGNQGESCRDIQGATGNEYTVKAADEGNTIRVVVTAKNADGTDTATSVPTAVITKSSGSTSTSTSANGCPKLAAGATAVAVADVASPARLQIDQIVGSPSVITRGTSTFTVKYHVSDTCGSPVKGAQVYAAGVPFGMISQPGQQTTDDNGFVSVQFRTLAGFPATPKQQLLVMFVRASKPGDPVLAGISTRRLVSLRVNLHG